MKNKLMTYIGSYSGESKKGNSFTVSHFYCEPDEKQKGIHGFSQVSFFLDDDTKLKVLTLKPLQRVSIDYLFANGSNILVNIQEIK